jgi:hypothetical protein
MRGEAEELPAPPTSPRCAPVSITGSQDAGHIVSLQIKVCGGRLYLSFLDADGTLDFSYLLTTLNKDLQGGK